VNTCPVSTEPQRAAVLTHSPPHNTQTHSHFISTALHWASESCCTNSLTSTQHRLTVT